MTRRLPRSTRLAIVDRPGTTHAAFMARCAALGQHAPQLVWVRPDHLLAERLSALRDVAAVALPQAPKPEWLNSPRIHDLMCVMRSLETRGIPVFVAAGNEGPNPLASAGRPVSPWSGSAALRVGEDRFGSSGACVRAASVFCVFQTRFASFIAPDLGREEFS